MREQEIDEEIERRAASAVGTVLDRKWRLDRLLGLGGMGAVYAATHRNGTRAAVKVLHPEAALSPALRRRFLREGYVANKVEHPGAVSILDDDIDPSGSAYLVMELLHGETLEGRLARAGGRLGVAEVIQIACGVLDCLEAAHARGIVHRDIKPGNLFLTTGSEVKVLDFGIARLTEARGKRGDTTGVAVLGTPDFMPPEQARGHWDQVDGRTDVFAVGAVMLYALTGMPLREAPTTNEQLLKAMTEPLPALATLIPSVNELVANLVDRAVAFRREDRWADCAAFRQAGRAAYGSVASHPLERAPPLSVRPVPNGALSPDALAPDALGSSEDAVLSMPAAALVPRSLSPTKLVGTRQRNTMFRVTAVVVTIAGALFAMTFGAGRPAPAPATNAVRVSGVTEPTFAVPEFAPSALFPTPSLSRTPAPPSSAESPADVAPGASSPVAEPSQKAPLLPGAHRGATAKRAVVGAAEAVSAPAALPASAPAGAPEPEAEPPHAVDLFSRRK